MMSPRAGVAICTVSTRSHLAYAHTLLASAKAHAPWASRYLLLIDDDDGSFKSVDGTTVLRPSQVVAEELFRQLVYRYNAAEVCFALKPVLLDYLLDSGYQQAHYMDGDAWLVGDFSLVTQRLDGRNVQLTPHLRSPLPLDGRNPTELSLLRSGTYNAGYVGVSQTNTAREFLAWWARRVHRWGINEPRFGMSGDQKWLDPVPHMFPGVSVSMDLGVNTAYWNLAGRRLTMSGSRYMIDGEPLILLHLSGFDPSRPQSLSRFQNRIDAEHHPVLSGLLQNYARQVIQAGHSEWSRSTYPHHRWWHGRALPLRMARALLFHVREARVARAAQAIPAPPTLNAELAGEALEPERLLTGSAGTRDVPVPPSVRKMATTEH